MTEKLHRVKTELNQVIENGKKVNSGIIVGAIEDLEQFPMTKALLQSTRIGKVLNEVRKLTDGNLASRIKAIIRSWRILVDDGKTSTVVVPVKPPNGTSHCTSPVNCVVEELTGGSCTLLRRVNGSSVSLPILDSSKVFIGSPTSQTSSTTSNAERNNHHKRTLDDSNLSKKRSRNFNQVLFSDETSFDSDSRPPANKYQRLNADESSNITGNGCSESPTSKIDRTSTQLSTTAPADAGGSSVPKLRIRLGGNGKSAGAPLSSNSSNKQESSCVQVLSPGLSNTTKSFQLSKDTDPQGDASSAVSGSTNRSSRQTAVNPPALPRVKSTAELLIQYGSEIKTQQKANILEIEREPDFVPSVLPETARPRRLRTPAGSSARNKTVPVGTSQDLLVIDSPAAFKKGKTSILEKFLASTVKYSDNDESDKDNSNVTVNDPGTYTVTNFVMNSTSASTTVSPPSLSVPANQHSPPSISNSKPVLSTKTRLDTSNSGTDKMENSETDAAIEDAELKRRHHKHKHKHKHKVKLKFISHPVTNLMDRRPASLPPLPDVDPSKYPYPIPKVIEATDETVDRLLHSEWEGLNCVVHGDTGKKLSFTEMYTLGLPEAADDPPDSVLHMLPWVDLNGWRRQYFPENALKYIDEFQLAKPR